MTLDFFIPLSTALWTGIVTAISPCPLTTNIIAITYITKHSNKSRVLGFDYGLFYAFGRAFSYIFIGFLISKTALSIESFSFFMQKYANQILSPILVIAGMYMNEMFGKNFSGFNMIDLSKIKVKPGLISCFFLGVIFSLAFCPVSAALYFGVIIPLSISKNQSFFIPLLYGFGTAIPVIISVLALIFGFMKISSLTQKTAKFERYAKPVTGWIFILAGIYLAFKYIFNF